MSEPTTPTIYSVICHGPGEGSLRTGKASTFDRACLAARQWAFDAGKGAASYVADSRGLIVASFDSEARS